MEKKDQCTATLISLATQSFISEAIALAGVEFFLRKARRKHPPGEFDADGCFWADERTKPVTSCAAPSRKYQYPEMRAARTAAHCAEVFGVTDVTLVKRVAIAFERLENGDVASATRLLRKDVRKRLAAFQQGTPESA